MNAGNKYPPILEIPPSSSPRDLKPVDVTFQFDTPKEMEGKFGTQYKYTVQVDGIEHTLFASKALHRMIEEHAIAKGTVLSIARLGSGKDTRWDVVYISGPKGSGAPAKAPQQTVSTPVPTYSPAGFTDDLARYWLAFDLALDTLNQKGLTPSVDANAVAFVIYKMAKEHGIADPSRPTATPVNTTQKAEAAGKEKMRSELEGIFKRTNLPEDLWLVAINLHTNGKEVEMWDEVTREVGLAVWGDAKRVENGETTWDELFKKEPTQEEIPW